MRRKRAPSIPARGRAWAALLGFMLVVCAAPGARANQAIGACCFNDASCDDLMAFQCEEAGGDFIGEGSSCANVNCRAPVAAPLLSAAGVIAVVSALVGVGVRRALTRRRS